MKSAAVLMAVIVTACGGTSAVEGELAAATFLVEAQSADVEVVGNDRIAAAGGTEERLEVVRPSRSMTIVSIHSGTPVPEPFEFVRDPLATGGVTPVLEGSERVIAVLHPLVDPTPGGRVLAGSLIAFGPGGNLVHTDWDDEEASRVSDLLAWGADRGLDPLESLELAVRGLGAVGEIPAEANEAADFFR